MIVCCIRGRSLGMDDLQYFTSVDNNVQIPKEDFQLPLVSLLV